MPDGTRCPACQGTATVRVPGPAHRWSYYRCANCGHWHLVPSPSREDLYDLYNSRYEVPLRPYLATADREYPILAALLRDRPCGRMLEIGCSYGGVLAAFAAAGWDVEGVELDGRAAAYASAHFGLRVHTGTLEGVQRELRGNYGVIAAYHVLEHILTPREFLAQVAGLLAPGGRFLLKTPNAVSFVARAARGWWQWACPPQHAHLYSPRSLAQCLAGAGLEIEFWRTRRGDAHGTLLELARGWASEVIRRGAVPAAQSKTSAGDATATRTTGGLRRRLESGLELVGGPLEWALERRWSRGAATGPEILAIARRVSNRSDS